MCQNLSSGGDISSAIMADLREEKLWKYKYCPRKTSKIPKSNVKNKTHLALAKVPLSNQMVCVTLRFQKLRQSAILRLQT